MNGILASDNIIFSIFLFITKPLLASDSVTAVCLFCSIWAVRVSFMALEWWWRFEHKSRCKVPSEPSILSKIVDSIWQGTTGSWISIVLTKSFQCVHFYLYFLPTGVFNFKMIVIFCHKKDFRQLFDTISVFCDILFWSSFASVYGPILGSFY